MSRAGQLLDELIARVDKGRAGNLYRDFHKYDPKSIGQFPASFSIPKTATCVGPAIHVLYRSSKFDPITYAKPASSIDYIHEHKKGVKVYIIGSDEGPERKVPQRIHAVDGLVSLGKCLGFAYVDQEGDQVDAECTGKVELYSVPSGTALLVIENKRKVLALIWGGKLRVEPRGIVG
jgi:hypothetical protein